MASTTGSSAPSAPPALSWRVWTLSTVGLSLIYVIVFALAARGPPTFASALHAACNGIPHVLLAIPLVERVAPTLTRLPVTRAVLIGTLSSIIYAACAYAATIFLLALTAQVEAGGIWVRFFAGPALPWQMFQSLSYAALALTFGLYRVARHALERATQTVSDAPKAQRWLVRTADGIAPVDPAEIIRIEAEGEYSRLVLNGRTVLSRIGLGECAARLRAEPFLRAHRSHLVNGDAIVRAESAGNGRLQLTLRNGAQIVTSREGARLVRQASV